MEIKKQIQMEANYQRERELALLNATSKVSDSLCRIYFLDGSFKTVFYDETVTAQDIAAKICFSVNVALFEVEKDIKDSTQYCLVPAQECIGDIIVRWGRNGLDCAKLVVPIYDVSSSMRGKAPPSLNTPQTAASSLNTSDLAVTGRQSMVIRSRGSFCYDSTTRGSIAGYPAAPSTGGVDVKTPPQAVNKRSSFSFFSSSKASTEGSATKAPLDGIPEANHTPAGLDGENILGDGEDFGSTFAAMQLKEEENALLRKELADLRKKYSILRSIHVKREKSERQKAKRAVLEKTSVGDTGLVGAPPAPPVPPLSDTALCTPSSPKKLAVASQTSMEENSTNESTNSVEEMEEGRRSVVDREQQEDDESEENDNVFVHEGILKKKNYFNKHYTPHLFVLKKDGRLYCYKKESDAKKKNGHSGKWDVRKCRCMVDKTDYRYLSITLPGKKMTLIAETDKEALDWVKVLSENSVAHGFPSAGTVKIAAKKKTDSSTEKQNLFTATSSKPEAVDDITTVLKQSSSKQVKVFLDKVNELELFFMRFDEIITSQFEHGVNDPQQMFHTYEIISAMQSLYGYVLHYGEQWSNDTKDWLLRMLRQKMSLPIEEPELLMAVIQCLTRENMLFSPETVNTVNQVIEMSFEEGSDPYSESTIEGVLNSVNRMVETLDQVVEDLMPLLPDDFNVITMFQEKANRKIKTDIKTFYATNKDNMNNRDLLTLLSFADSQMHTLEKFGVDTKVISDLNSDLLRQYTSVTQRLMKTWMSRIHDIDTKPDSECHVQEGLGQCTHWPGDLMACVGEHLNLAVQELTIYASEKVICLMLDMLPDFIHLQHAWAETVGRTCPPERMCAYVNNMLRFAFLLQERQELIEDDISDSEKIYDAFNVTIKAFRDEAERGVDILVQLVAADFKEGLSEGLFKEEWVESRQVAETLRVTLQEYVQDLKIWLVVENHVKKVLLGVLKVVAGSYLELLLTTGVLVTGNVGERLQEDFEIMQHTFRELTMWLHIDVVDRELKPLNDTIAVLRMDLRRMAQFVRTELYQDFGGAYMKIWQTIMAMRDESRQVHDAVFEAITKGWTPTAIKPLCEISYQEKLRAPHHKARMSMRYTK
eukprot:CAMPEP_0185023544 /NCGR_PEP_ID=MMETSP1103-20130426/6202_1 /TAXON_ID=36769 /ORGANISM="Paraphysomonas bandaiensis, Strain Caron Lab Isolate" /LENGTH=1103 /DNA_ID=CAMNT_0027556179 /DNA_START=252 /DNA_END=3563 /DNA_ORIENTATION=-